MKYPYLILSLTVAAASLSACSGLREDLGLGRNPPDEFAVVDHAPLSMPPDFSLRPPAPGAPRPQESDSASRASDAVFGGNPNEPANGYAADASAMEKALLQAANADQTEPGIRDKVDRETAGRTSANPHLMQSLLGWVRNDKVSTGTTVDAAAEAARIKEAKEKGEPVSDGATPVIEREKSGWLGL